MNQTVPDIPISYAYIFADTSGNEMNNMRQEMIQFKLPADKIMPHAQEGKVPADTCAVFERWIAFEHSSDKQRSEILASNAKCNDFFRMLLSVIQVCTDAKTVMWCLTTLNGILEDSRSRVKNILTIQKAYGNK